MPGPSLDERVRDIVAHAYDKTPAMRQRMEQAGLTPADIQSADDLAKLPVMTKDDMVKLQASSPPFGGMLAVDQSKLAWVFISPGPLYEGVADVDAAIQATVEVLEQVGFTGDDVVLNALSYNLVPFGLVFDAGVRALGATVLPTGIGNTEIQVKMMLDLGATAYVGTPSFLLTIIQKAESLGVDFHKVARLRKAIVTAEPLTPSLRATLEGYGIHLANLYGTAELGLLGYEQQVGCGFSVPDDKLIQVCDPQTGQPLPGGEMGEVVATNFSRDYPLIRIGTGDLSIMSRESGPCGDGPRLLGWMGRSGEAVKVRGMFVHPNQLKMVMGRFAEVERYQAVIGRSEQRDELVLRVAAQPGADEAGLCNRLMEALPGVLRVRPDQIEIVPSASLVEGAPVILDQRRWD